MNVYNMHALYKQIYKIKNNKKWSTETTDKNQIQYRKKARIECLLIPAQMTFDSKA